MSRILLTNAHLREVGGSEVVTLELAETFVRLGWIVDVYAHTLAQPFSREFDFLDNFGGKLSDDTSAFGVHNYDLIWVQHSAIPDSVLTQLEAPESNTRIIWNHMSSFAGFELPLIAGVESQVANLICYVSPETLETLQKFNLPVEKTRPMQNPVPKNFIDALSLKHTGHLSTLIFVSNHPPIEVLDAAELLEKQGIRVLHVGKNKQRRITPEVLQQADAVITIGKTVQYSLSLGLPVYEYDHFGGCGWLIEDNFEYEMETNFSGRGTHRSLNATEIVAELFEGYELAREFAEKNITKFRERFDLESRLSELVNEALALPAVSIKPYQIVQWQSLSNTLRIEHRKNFELYEAFTAQLARVTLLESIVAEKEEQITILKNTVAEKE